MRGILVLVRVEIELCAEYITLCLQIAYIGHWKLTKLCYPFSTHSAFHKFIAMSQWPLSKQRVIKNCMYM
jgi:hypothetical protein